jgi:hypothetical protein
MDCLFTHDFQVKHYQTHKQYIHVVEVETKEPEQHSHKLAMVTYGWDKLTLVLINYGTLLL